MKIIGIILIVLQIVSLFGSVASGSISALFYNNFAYVLGYFLPGIIGVILLAKASKKK